MLAVARALVASLRVLVLHEPTAGPPPPPVAEVFVTSHIQPDTRRPAPPLADHVNAPPGLACRGASPFSA